MEHRFLDRFLICVTTAALGVGLSAGVARSAQNGAPPLPHVGSVDDIGTVGQNSIVYGRDGTASALLGGASVWTFGDTAMSKNNCTGTNFISNSLSWTTELDATHGIRLEHDHLDSCGAFTQFLPFTPFERQYNYTHGQAHCTQQPCGANFGIWPGPVVADPARKRALFYYAVIYRKANSPGWTTVGEGIAVGTPGRGVVRPLEGHGRFPTLMWDAQTQGYTDGATVAGQTLYSYGCVTNFLTKECRIARVALADALDLTKWTYYAGNGAWTSDPNAAVTDFDGGAAGNSVVYDSYLGGYFALYSGVFSNDVYFRVAHTPWGPWSPQTLLFTGKPGYQSSPDYAALVHAEFAQGGGQTQYVTYVHATGFLQSEIRLVRVTFANDAGLLR